LTLPPHPDVKRSPHLVDFFAFPSFSFLFPPIFLCATTAPSGAPGQIWGAPSVYLSPSPFVQSRAGVFFCIFPPVSTPFFGRPFPKPSTPTGLTSSHPFFSRALSPRFYYTFLVQSLPVFIFQAISRVSRSPVRFSLRQKTPSFHLATTLLPRASVLFLPPIFHLPTFYFLYFLMNSASCIFPTKGSSGQFPFPFTQLNSFSRDLAAKILVFFFFRPKLLMCPLFFPLCCASRRVFSFTTPRAIVPPRFSPLLSLPEMPIATF